ncbi:MAG: hypothetical protein WCO05_00255 [Candidatus Moraniibacteriota bacterium]
MSITKKEWQAVADQLQMTEDALRKKCTSVISAAGGRGFIKKRSFILSIKDGKIIFPSLMSSSFWSVDLVTWTATCHSYPAGTPAGSKAGTNACGHRLPPSSTGNRR